MIPQLNPVAQVADLSVRYGTAQVLSGISTSIVPSEIRVILGASGCGKTTLLKAMVGLLKPAAGSVRLFGVEIGDQDDAATIELLKKVGVLFQNGALLGSLTIEENIALPLQIHTGLPPRLIREIVSYKLAQVKLTGVGLLLPSELSGGMRKRAALARALVLDPPLLFCDEPSAGLDPVTAAGLDRLLLTLRETLGITIVVVTHELHSIESIADNISFLHNGSLLFDGPFAEAQKRTDGPMHDFFARQENIVTRAGETFPDFFVENNL
ncbi:MAG: ATP-binding cassette domain-containing protein [Chitinispirillaceae bacterium]|nr:ATP-binding cassette domain-containing protein [Chitinispirillaceae bacterium]